MHHPPRYSPSVTQGENRQVSPFGRVEGFSLLKLIKLAFDQSRLIKY